MPSYLEIALRVTGPLHALRDKQKSTESQPCPVPATAAPRREVSGAENLATCGLTHCAGCYDLGDGRKIHPPKCGEEYRKWLERWKPNGRVQ